VNTLAGPFGTEQSKPETAMTFRLAPIAAAALLYFSMSMPASAQSKYEACMEAGRAAVSYALSQISGMADGPAREWVADALKRVFSDSSKPTDIRESEALALSQVLRMTVANHAAVVALNENERAELAERLAEEAASF
jgi:hypothetical protein